ncbi:hypothetical protein C0991_001864 [Blastosporella zonata]|nr:hypothetical protein C0991_001864 [Blastosporella zonata]
MLIASTITATSSSHDLPVIVLVSSDTEGTIYSRKFIARPTRYADLVSAARHAFRFAKHATLVFGTSTLDVCRGNSIEIDESAYAPLFEFLDEITVVPVEQHKDDAIVAAGTFYFQLRERTLSLSNVAENRHGKARDPGPIVVTSPAVGEPTDAWKRAGRQPLPQPQPDAPTTIGDGKTTSIPPSKELPREKPSSTPTLPRLSTKIPAKPQLEPEPKSVPKATKSRLQRKPEPESKSVEGELEDDPSPKPKPLAKPPSRQRKAEPAPILEPEPVEPELEPAPKLRQRKPAAPEPEVETEPEDEPVEAPPPKFRPASKARLNKPEPIPERSKPGPAPASREPSFKTSRFRRNIVRESDDEIEELPGPPPKHAPASTKAKAAYPDDTNGMPDLFADERLPSTNAKEAAFASAAGSNHTPDPEDEEEFWRFGNESGSGTKSKTVTPQTQTSKPLPLERAPPVSEGSQIIGVKISTEPQTEEKKKQARADQPATRQDERFSVEVYGPIPDQEAEFRTRGGHKVRKVLDSVCKTFGYPSDKSRLLLSIQVDGQEALYLCDPDEMIWECGIGSQAQLKLQVEGVTVEEEEETEEEEEEED